MHPADCPRTPRKGVTLALRTNISERQLRLGFELRKLRLRAGLSGGEAGNLIGMGRAHLGHIEAARTAIPGSRLRALCHAYGVTNEPYVDALVSMSEASGKGWWTDYRRRAAQPALDLAELEASGSIIQTHETVVVPGLFQTEEYMRAIFSDVRLVHSTIDNATAFRLERQRILTGEAAPAVHAVIHEAALHMRFCKPQALRDQLLRLIELARLPNITIQVIPFDANAYAAFCGPFLHVIPAVRGLGTVVIDRPGIGMGYLRDEEDLETYRTMFDQLVQQALPPIEPSAAPESRAQRDSLGLIQHLLYAR